MNNIPINTNDDNNKKVEKKSSKKKKILGVVLIALIVHLLISTVLQFDVGASDLDIVANIVNEVEWLETPNATIEPSNTNPAGTMQDAGSLTSNNRLYYNYDPMTDDRNRLLIPDFTVWWNGFDNRDTNNFGNTKIYLFVIVKNINSDNFSSSFYYQYKLMPSGYVQEVSQNFYVSDEYTIIGISWNNYFNDDTDEVMGQPYYNMMVNATNPQSARTDFVFGGYVLGYDLKETAQMAINICDYKNELETPPTNEVFGSDEIIVTSDSTAYYYEPQNITVYWDNYYMGMIVSAKLDNGQPVHMYVNVFIQKDAVLVGDIVILDDVYNGYIFEVDLEGSAEYGQLKFSITKTTEFDVKYVAISDNYTMLSEHIVSKVNEYNEVGDSESYQAGYADGFKVGQQTASIGAFANTQLDVQWSFREVATGLVYEFYQQYPITVNAGGISFEEVWYWYMNSAYNDRAYVVQEVNFYITFTNENTLFKNSSFWWGNESNSELFLPYATYLVPTNISITNKLAVIEKYGDYFYITSDDLVDKPIEQIRFSISNDNASYYDIFITNKLTLYTDINQTIIDNQSYYLGEVKGIEYGQIVGYEKGEKDGYDKGYDKAYEDAKRDFYDKGFSAGKDEGYDVGFLKGREQGMNEDFNFYMIPLSIMDAYTETFFGLLDFTFFGVNMAGFFLELLTIAVVAFIWKKVK